MRGNTLQLGGAELELDWPSPGIHIPTSAS
eukprot:COSAG02_NODE_38220_length_431_cov_6.805660_1_plen_29_part_10